MRLLIPQCLWIWIYLAAVINKIRCETCPGLESESVDIFCKYKGDVVPCESPNEPGTKATLSCKHSYRIPVGNDPGYRELTCLAGGAWDRFVFNCIAECGTGVSHGKTFIINGNMAQVGAFPWHVGIYRTSRAEPYEQICGGTLVSPNLVVSAAHCFFDESRRKVINANQYAVAAGKYYRPYNISLVDIFAQKSSVKKIEVAERYFGATRNYEQDIALVHLEKRFTLTALVRPVCMDWDNTYERQHLQSGKSGKIVGWGKTAKGEPSPILQEISLPYIHYENCIASVPEDFRGYVTADKFCAGFLNGSSLCEGDSGGGLCFQLDGRWYLRGVVSVGPIDRGMCDRNYYTAFTNVGTFLPWIQAAIVTTRTGPGGLFPNTVIQRGSCVLPEQPTGGSYELGSCNGPCTVVPGTKVPIGTFISYKCNDGYILYGYNISFCYKEGWHVSPACHKTCPTLRAKNMDIECRYQGRIISCESAVAPGTSATLNCKNFYTIASADDPGYREITCLEDGAWDHTVFDCVPECGLPADDGIWSVVNGSLVIDGKFPWTVQIYFAIPGASRLEGTLVSSDLVITDASRFADWITEGKVRDTIAFRHVVLSYAPGPYRQSSLVTSIHVAEGYASRPHGHYANNIALVRLETPFIMTAVVKPICMDWNTMFEREIFLEESKTDKTSEWRGVSNSENQAISLPYISHEECLSRVQDKFRLQDDTFCIGCGKGSSYCSSNGHGGSFACESHGLWYLLGYRSQDVHASADSQCDHFTTFTNIGPYLDWIRAAYNASAR